MFGPILLLLIIVPALEFYLLFTLGSALGAFNTFALILLTGVVGASLVKTQGLEVLHSLQEKVERGELPHFQLAQGFCLFGGGLLLVTPGFFTDVVGFSMVLPGTRHLIAKWLLSQLEKGMKKGTVNFQFTQFSRGNPNPSDFSPGGDEIPGFRPQGQKHQGEVIEVEFSKKDEDS